MVIDTEKSILNINQIIASKFEKNVIEGDIIVPDVKPDVEEIISSSGIINIYKKEVGEGKVRIDGSISTYIMYVANEDDENSTRSINHTLDFSQIIATKNSTSEMSSSIKVTIGNVNCKIINERKINVKVDVDFDVKVFTNSNIEFVNNVDVVNIQKLEKTANVNSILGMGRTNTNIKETISLKDEDNLSEILKVSTSIINVDTKTSYNKTLTKADVILKILYLTDDSRCISTTKCFPIMGFIDMKDIGDNNVCISNVETKNVLIKPNGAEEHTISIDMDFEISVITYEKKEINIIEDLYSPSVNLSFQKKNIKTIQNVMTAREIMNLDQREILDIGDEKIYDLDSKVIIESTKISDNEINISGNIQFTFTHSINQITGIGVKTISVPYTYKIPTDKISNDAQVDLYANVISNNFNIINSSEVNIKEEIEFVANISNYMDINVIESVEESEQKIENNYNMVIYFTKPNDNLWKIAKKFNSTKESIMSANNLEDENIKVGTQLFISKM